MSYPDLARSFRRVPKSSVFSKIVFNSPQRIRVKYILALIHFWNEFFQATRRFASPNTTAYSPHFVNISLEIDSIRNYSSVSFIRNYRRFTFLPYRLPRIFVTVRRRVSRTLPISFAREKYFQNQVSCFRNYDYLIRNSHYVLSRSASVACP